MKEITADFIRQEINRLGGIVVETALYHASGVKLHTAGDFLTLTQAKQMHEAAVTKLFLLDVGEDEWVVRKKLGVVTLIPSRVEVGDQLVEDLRTPSGQILLAAGTVVDDAALERLRSAPVLAVPVRHRNIAALEKQAQDYLALNPATTAPVKESMTRIGRAPTAESAAIRYLLLPRAKILVAMSDDLLRTLILNALRSEGHEVIDGQPASDVLRFAEKERPHLILLGLEESIRLLPVLREDGGLRQTGIIVCGDLEQTALLNKALLGGANDSLPKPPSRSALNDRITGYQAMLGRKVGVPPTVRRERRRFPRQAAKGTVTFKDPQREKPLPIINAELMDIGDGGLRVDYNLPNWPVSWAYSVHGVHPKHFWYEYALNNPAGRALRVQIPNPRGGSVEKIVRVAHVMPADDLEILGLCFPDVRDPSAAKPAVTRKF